MASQEFIQVFVRRLASTRVRFAGVIPKTPERTLYSLGGFATGSTVRSRLCLFDRFDLGAFVLAVRIWGSPRKDGLAAMQSAKAARADHQARRPKPVAAAFSQLAMEP
jgi:hypothetical protein